MKLSILAAPLPGAGTPSAARGPLEGNVGPDFGALLGGLAKDAPAGTTPALVPAAPPLAEAAASVTGELVPGNGDEPELGSQQRAFLSAEGEPQPSDVLDVAAQPVAGVAKAPGVTSLLRLAARAATPGAKVAGSAVPAAEGAQASDHDVRKASKPDADTPAGVVADATAVAAALLVAASAIVPATVPAGAGITQPLPRSDAPMPAGASAPEAGIVPVPASAGATLPTVNDASISLPTLPTIAAPTTAAGKVGSAPAPPPAATSVDAAIVPGSVRVESHLGFDRNARIGAAAASGRDTTGGAKGAPVEPSQLEGSSSDLRSSAALDPSSAGADVEVVDASSPRPPKTGDIASSNGDAPSVAPPAAMRAAEAVAAPSRAASAPDIPSPIGARLLAGPPSTSSAPEAEDAAANDVAGATSSRSAHAHDMASSTGTGRLAVLPSTALTQEARRPAAAATSFVGSPPATAEATSPDEVALSVAATTKPATNEPNTPASTKGPATTAPVAVLAMPNPRAALPVVQQVAESVAGLAATVVPDEPGSDTKVAPARTMALQLSPAGLGTLTVRLHVTGRALDVHLEASDGRTAALIDRDRDALTGALRGKDYQLQTLSVTTHDATMPGGTHAERGTDSRSADAGSTDPGSSGRSRDEPSGGRTGGGSAREAPERTARPSQRLADEASLERGGSSLFV